MPTRWIDPGAALRRVPRTFLRLYNVARRGAAFRLRRRTVKQRKSKSRSQGDKYRPTGVHTEHGCLRRVLRTKVKRVVHTPTRAERKPFSRVDIVAKTLERSLYKSPFFSSPDENSPRRRCMRLTRNSPLRKIFLSLIYIYIYIRVCVCVSA